MIYVAMRTGIYQQGIAVWRNRHPKSDVAVHFTADVDVWREKSRGR